MREERIGMEERENGNPIEPMAGMPVLQGSMYFPMCRNNRE
jgi:hypothetical protein